MSRRRSRPAGWLVALGSLLVLAPAGPGAAQTAPPDDGANDPEVGADDRDEVEVSLRVSALTGVLGPGSGPPIDDDDPRDVPETAEDLELRVLVENTGDVEVGSLRLVVELHPAARSRDQLRSALDGEPSTPAAQVHDLGIEGGQPLRPDELAGVADVFERGEVDWAEPGGVHPLVVSVRRGSEVLDTVGTAVIWLDQHPDEPLRTSVVWPLDTEVWRGAGGAYPERIDDSLAPGGRLDVLLRTLERRPDAPVTLAPAAHLLEDLQDRADGFAQLERRRSGSVRAREVSERDPAARTSADVLERLRVVADELPFAPVAGAYANADLGGMLTTEPALDELAARAAVDGRRRLRTLLERAPDPTTSLVAGPLTPEALALLPGEHLLLPAEAVADEDRGPLRDVRSPSGRLSTASVADASLTASLTDPPSDLGPVVTAQNLLAETAAIHLEASPAAPRALTIAPPPRWSPDPRLAQRLLDGLVDATWLDLVPPGEQSPERNAPGSPLELADPTGGGIEPELARGITDAREELDAARAAGVLAAGTVDGGSYDDLGDTLLRATSRTLRGGDDGEQLLEDVETALDDAFGDIEVASSSRVTLTSDEGSIPVTLRRTEGDPLDVRVEVASQGRLVWPGGREVGPLTLEEDSSRTVAFDTRALSTGDFSVAVRVTDPTGAHELERTTLSVRSTAISGTALTAIGGLVLALLLAGALRRRGRRPPLEVVGK